MLLFSRAVVWTAVIAVVASYDCEEDGTWKTTTPNYLSRCRSHCENYAACRCVEFTYNWNTYTRCETRAADPPTSPPVVSTPSRTPVPTTSSPTTSSPTTSSPTTSSPTTPAPTTPAPTTPSPTPLPTTSQPTSSECGPLEFGPTCEPVKCNVNNGVCLDGMCSGKIGTGACDSCQEGFHGAYCDQETLCLHGVCESGSCQGVAGDGKCSSCSPGWDGAFCDRCDESSFGPECASTISCDKGLCLPGSCSGTGGSGTCTLCSAGWTGPTCDEEACSEHGEKDPVTGNCIRCDSGWRGQACDVPVECTDFGGICNEGTCAGVQGTGTCDDCFEGFFGPTCQAVTCDTTQGDCSFGCDGVNGNGECTTCQSGFEGSDCDLPSEENRSGFSRTEPTGDDASPTLVPIGVVAGAAVGAALVVGVLAVVASRSSKTRAQVALEVQGAAIILNADSDEKEDQL